MRGRDGGRPGGYGGGVRCRRVGRVGRVGRSLESPQVACSWARPVSASALAARALPLAHFACAPPLCGSPRSARRSASGEAGGHCCPPRWGIASPRTTTPAGRAEGAEPASGAEPSACCFQGAGMPHAATTQAASASIDGGERAATRWAPMSAESRPCIVKIGLLKRPGLAQAPRRRDRAVRRNAVRSTARRSRSCRCRRRCGREVGEKRGWGKSSTAAPSPSPPSPCPPTPPLAPPHHHSLPPWCAPMRAQLRRARAASAAAWYARWSTCGSTWTCPTRPPLLSAPRRSTAAEAANAPMHPLPPVAAATVQRRQAGRRRAAPPRPTPAGAGAEARAAATGRPTAGVRGSPAGPPSRLSSSRSSATASAGARRCVRVATVRTTARTGASTATRTTARAGARSGARNVARTAARTDPLAVRDPPDYSDLHPRQACSGVSPDPAHASARPHSSQS
jgi:hypothetical protein